MRIQVSCSLEDHSDLIDWIDNQEFMTVQVWDADDEVQDPHTRMLTIVPHWAASTPLEAASAAQVWSRFVLQLFSQQLCY